MHIVHVASELAPIAKVGGLADVVHSLAKEFAAMGHTVEVILPRYNTLTDMPSVLDGIKITYLEVKDYFNRGHIYCEPDDTDRFIGFSKEAASRIPKGALLHAHDWPSAAAALYYKGPSLLTIHNIKHRGACLPAKLGLPVKPDWADPEFEGQISLLKAAILECDYITTVSPTYAKEIETADYGYGLEGAIHKRHDHIKGILNGIDYDYWNPEADPYLVTRAELQKELGMNPPSGPLAACITRLDEQKGPHLIKAALRHTLEKGGQFILLGSAASTTLQKEFDALKSELASNKDVHFHFTYNEALGHKVYGAADLILVPSIFEPCGLTQMLAMRYGALPLVRLTGGLADTVVDGKNGFTFLEPKENEICKTLDRAFALYKTGTWEEMVKTAKETDVSWKRSAREYLRIYRLLDK